MIAKNLGNFVTLFDKQIVKEEFLPMFFKCCEDKVARVCEPTTSALAPILIKFEDEKDQ